MTSSNLTDLVTDGHTVTRQNGLAPENITATALRRSSAKKLDTCIFIFEKALLKKV